MSVFSRFLQLSGGVPRGIDLSTNTLSVGALQVNGSTSGNLTFESAATTASYSIIWPAAQASAANYGLLNNGSGTLSWASVVTSVALSDTSSTPIYSISGSPVTSSGTLSFSLHTQNANLVFAGPSSGGAAQPSFRALVAADLPTVGSANTISNTFVAGTSFSANISYIVRWGMNALGETTDRIYPADYDTTSYDEFWALGIAFSSSDVSAGQSINVYSFGIYTLGSADTDFTTAEIGTPVWLTSSGAFSTTSPSGTSQADFKIGVVVSTTQMWIDDQLLGVGGASSGAGPEPLPVDQGGTGVASFTAYAPVIGGTTSTGDLQSAASGMSNSGYVLTSNGSSAAPTWQAAAGGFTGYRAGKAAISNGATSVSITFSSTLGSTNYAITCNLLNTTDSNPVFEPVTITAQSATGFTASLNGPVPTANYYLSWSAINNN